MMIAMTPAKIGRTMKKFTNAEGRMSLVLSDAGMHCYEEAGRRRTAGFSTDRKTELWHRSRRRRASAPADGDHSVSLASQKRFL
jgi:hypothetical protein